MGYCTLDDLMSACSEKTLRELTDDAAAGAIDTDIVADAIAGASGEVDAYCQGRYAAALPFSPVPPIILGLTVDIALYRLRKRRQRMTDVDRKSYEDAVRTLERIASGSVQLGVSTVSEDTISFTAKRPEDRIFRNPLGY